MTLQAFFKENPKAAIAFSGGVDSAFLLYAAKQAGADVTAYYVKTPFQPQFEYADAVTLAEQLQVRMTVLSLDVLADPQIAANPRNRCYFCKKKIFTAIAAQAKQDGYQVILDGTNFSDDPTDRPGMQALQELAVLSPLRLCSLTKNEIRRLSKEADLFTHDKPAYACLATRIPTGMPITTELLEKTERNEGYLMGLGFRDFRIRITPEGAKLQIKKEQFPLLEQHRQEVFERLTREYGFVSPNPEVRE
jgi:uncharacterized protein